MGLSVDVSVNRQWDYPDYSALQPKLLLAALLLFTDFLSCFPALSLQMCHLGQIPF